MLWAASALCFFGFFRSGELTVPSYTLYDEGAHLSFRDVSLDSLDNPQVLQVRVKASKTDPFCIGVDVYVGRTNCPVAAVLSYMAARCSKQSFFKVVGQVSDHFKIWLDKYKI